MSRILFLVVGLSMVFCEHRIFADDRTERTNMDEIDKLIMRLRSKDIKTRVKAAETLGDMGENASPASEALCEAITAQSRMALSPPLKSPVGAGIGLGRRGSLFYDRSGLGGLACCEPSLV